MEPHGGRVPSALERTWRRLLRSLLPARVDLYYSPRYAVGFGGTPIDPHRGERILGFLFAQGLLPRRFLHRARRASLKTLRQVHTDAYLESLHDMAALAPIVGYEPDDEAGELAIVAQRHGVGGTVAAMRRALEHRRVAVNLGGGFHHAEPGAGRGFCIFNDVAVAIRDARRRGLGEPVLVVDLDLHDGNGTRRVFAEDETVFTFSIHNQSWDELPAVASLSLELAGEVEDGPYLTALREHLPPVVESLRPGLVVYLAGTDPAADDALGNWRLTADGLFARDRYVVELLRARCGRLPLVVLLAGGYGSRTWRYSARFLAWLLSGREEIEPPSTGEATLARLRELAPFLVRSEHRPDSGDELFSLTEEDVYGSLGEIARRTRLLDYFSRHGIELVLERSGLFDRLRRNGFSQPTLDFDLDNPSGQTLRVFGDAERQELLIEARIGRERRALEGLDLLRLEWLLIQNPRAAFTAERPRLPGQTHPGMGLLPDLMALILLLAEQLRLDGVFFVPSHYHLAVKGTRFLRFVDPDHEAFFRAVRDAVAPLPLGEATRAVASGEVVDAATGDSVAWRPMSMVLPLSDELRARLAGEAFEAEVERRRRGYDFRLRPP